MDAEQNSREQQKPLSAEEIEELRELEAKATSWPWQALHPGRDVVFGGRGETYTLFVGQGDKTDTNAALIAAMRNALPRLLAMLQPPADAEVREAAEHVLHWYDGRFHTESKIGKAILTVLRAAQAPRLTGEQEKFIRNVIALGDVEWATPDGQPPSDIADIIIGARAAFPELGEG